MIGTVTPTPAATPGPSHGIVDKREKKPEASLYPDTHPLQEKKTRHYTGDEHQLPDGTGEDYLLPEGQFETHINIDIGEEENGISPVHVLPQPINPNDIGEIASSLRALMLPEIKLVIRESMKEVTKSLKDGMDKLHKDVVDLRSVSLLSNLKLIALSNIVAGIACAYRASPKSQKKILIRMSFN